MSPTETLPESWKPLVKEPAVVAPLVTGDQLELIKRTVAKDATVDELRLYLYDCQRQGVHPLDKLIHFTKRGGKYTPITSIDFMRTRAADTGEYAGSDDASFETHDSEGYPLSSRVTVWRLVQGQRCSFTATARWSEYCPAQGQDHMWRRMPHTMLAKCAEALALRKGFPRQLAGLYATEELDQAASTGYTVEAPRLDVEPSPLGTPQVSDYGSTQNTQPRLDGAVVIRRVDTAATKKPGITQYRVTFSDGETLSTIKDKLGALCQQWCQDAVPVEYDFDMNGKFKNLVAVTRVGTGKADTEPPPPSDDDITF